MINLNAGNLWDMDYLNAVIELNKEFGETIRVESLFGSISGLTPTARAFDRIPYLGWVEIDKYVDRATKNGMSIRYTLNQSCIGPLQDFHRDWETTLKGTIQELHDIGVREWTVTSPLLIRLLRAMFPEDFIEVSTIAEISTPEEMAEWRYIGANGANLSTSINRNFDAVEEIAGMDAEVSLLANEACLFRCPWRRECYNLSSHNSSRSEDLFDYYPFRDCNLERMVNPSEWVRSRLILPQWMRVYQKSTGVNWFKIAFRTHPKEVALPILRLYMEQDFHGDLLDLWPTIAHLGATTEPKDKTHIYVDKLEGQDFLSHFMSFGYDCDTKTCEACGYCETVYNKAKRTGSK